LAFYGESGTKTLSGVSMEYFFEVFVMAADNKDSAVMVCEIKNYKRAC